jgi:hypothetical protein
MGIEDEQVALIKLEIVKRMIDDFCTNNIGVWYDADFAETCWKFIKYLKLILRED